MAAIVWSRESRKNRSTGEPGTSAPAYVAASTPAAPTSEASTTLPLRNRYMYQPTNRAIGIVQAIVNVPHELPGTSRLASLGRTNPTPSGPSFIDEPGGIERRNGSWNVISWSCPLPNRYV